MCCIRRLLPIACAIAALAAPGAAAQVYVDPESPSGKEYALPLESQRRQADPARRSGAKVVPGEQTSPLFGEGIQPARKPRKTVATRGARRTRRVPRPSATPLDEQVQEALQAAAGTPGAPDSGAGTPLAMIGGALVLLGLGGAAGYALRRHED